MKKYISFAVCLTALLVVIAGCRYNEARNTDSRHAALKKNNIGFEYKVICIEGKQFIAYRAAYNYWHIAGTGMNCHN